MWQPPAQPLRPPASSTSTPLSEAEKRQKYEQHLKEMEAYLDKSLAKPQSNPPASAPGALPLPQINLPVKPAAPLLTPEEKYQQHYSEYLALYPSVDTDNADSNPHANNPQHFVAYPGVSPAPTFSNGYPGSPQPLLPPPAGSSYSTIVPALYVPSYKATEVSQEVILPEELAQIRAAEAASLAERKLIGREICNNSIQPEQQKDYDKIKKIWNEASGKNLSLLEKFLLVLNYYTCGDNLFKSIVNSGRKNLTEVEPIVQHLEAMQKAKIPFGDEELTQQVLEGLYKIPLNNAKGTLATVIQFLTQQMKAPSKEEHLHRRSFYF